MKLSLNCLISLLFLIFSQTSLAQTKVATEERFQDLFITAGYSTAFGAGLGAAVLGLSKNPGSKLHYLAIGASLGFIGGSILGTYVVFFPIIGGRSSIGMQTIPIDYPNSKPSLVSISPVFNLENKRVDKIEANWLITKF